MTAIEFVRDHGIEQAKNLLVMLKNLGCPDEMKFGVINGMWQRTSNGFTYNELQNLVDSWELVESYGGMPMAKRQLSLFLRVNSERGTEPSVRVTNLKQAIADRESIGVTV